MDSDDLSKLANKAALKAAQDRADEFLNAKGQEFKKKVHVFAPQCTDFNIADHAHQLQDTIDRNLMLAYNTVCMKINPKIHSDELIYCKVGNQGNCVYTRFDIDPHQLVIFPWSTTSAALKKAAEREKAITTPQIMEWFQRSRN